MYVCVEAAPDCGVGSSIFNVSTIVDTFTLFAYRCSTRRIAYNDNDMHAFSMSVKSHDSQNQNDTFPPISRMTAG